MQVWKVYGTSRHCCREQSSEHCRREHELSLPPAPPSPHPFKPNGTICFLSASSPTPYVSMLTQAVMMMMTMYAHMHASTHSLHALLSEAGRASELTRGCRAVGSSKDATENHAIAHAITILPDILHKDLNWSQPGCLAYLWASRLGWHMPMCRTRHADNAVSKHDL